MLGGIATKDERKAFRSNELLVGIVKGDAIAHRCRVKPFFVMNMFGHSIPM